MEALQLAQLFHETYERLAPAFGYNTRFNTRVFEPVSRNGKLMIAVCTEILEKLQTGTMADLNDTIQEQDKRLVQLRTALDEARKVIDTAVLLTSAKRQEVNRRAAAAWLEKWIIIP